MIKEELPEGMRRCTHCKQILTIDHFSRNKTGLQSWCKRCNSEATRIRNKKKYLEDPAYRQRILDAKAQTTQTERARAIVARSNELSKGVQMTYGSSDSDE